MCGTHVIPEGVYMAGLTPIFQFVADQTASVGEADSTKIVDDNLTGWNAVECDDLPRWGSWPSETMITSACALRPGVCPREMKGVVIGPKNRK